ncbi:hypothetical protein A1O3_04763 [Capronia epimyces CBS 606.96]|uniref:Muramoyltetrapeptide carboxypeptidase n=1 Tax=Capronia epimyces CBS 606.96 TaxID=1182542 RepID=W9Y4E1_9EURO|nr:uncharacterized protein A1O3_04763 [Capronia epimyces CBS 606.96]EXJ84096.1 hypothetical protein A1O3_04763 [Capronia epimyces CBS 606.96]
MSGRLSPAFTRPPPLQPTSVIRVFSPAGSIGDESLRDGRAYLEAQGYRVDQPATVLERYNYFAGSKTSRARELYDAVLKQEEGCDSVIWAARGGYGSSQMIEEGMTAQMLDDLEQELAQNPKWLVGYSDITVISLRLWAKARVLVLHGPMVFNVAEYCPAALRDMWTILTGTEPHTQVFEGDIRYGSGLAGSSGTLARGTLLGGNLQVLASLVGAKDQGGQDLLPSFDGCILLLEEVGDAAYRIHRSLRALLRAPGFQSLAGIALGQLTSANNYARGKYDQYEVLHELLEPLGIPVITALEIGHEAATAWPIVLGADAEIHVSGELRVFVPGCA